jgi:hypothetical protein
MNNSYSLKKKPFFDSFKPWIISLLLLPFVVYYTLNAGKFMFIDYVNLLIHEGGHGIFRIFGRFIYTLGGSLMQVLIPGMFVVFYAVKRARIGTQVFLLWLGENFINISVYVSDARARKLPLLGGHKVYHDWNWLLGQMGLLEYDELLGQIVFGFGIIAFILCLIIPLFIKERVKENSIPIDLNL